MAEENVLEAIAELKKVVSEQGIGVANKDIEKILLILNGNGHPQDGMVYKVSEVYNWMRRHTSEHEKEREKLAAVEEERKKSIKSHRDEAISVIIKWLMPILVYGIATWIAENAHLF